MPVEMLDPSKSIAVRVIEPFYVNGNIVRVGDVVQINSIDAHDLIQRNKAEPVD